MRFVGASQDVLQGLDENGGSIVRTTLYMQGAEIVKLWYEILNCENAVVEKGCVSARIQEKGLGNADIRVVEGTSLVKPSLDCVTAHVNVRLIKCHILRGESSAFVLYVLPPDSNVPVLPMGFHSKSIVKMHDAGTERGNPTASWP